MPNKTPLRDVQRDGHVGGRLRQVDDMVTGRGAHAGSTAATLSQTGAPMPARQAPRPGPMDNLNRHIGKARRVLGLRDGMAIVRGPGGPTGDKIPARLSDGEAVLPADTVAAVGPDNIQALIDATHTKGKTTMAGGVLRAAGGYSPNRQQRDGIKPTLDMAREQILRDQEAANLRQARAASRAAGVTRATGPELAQARGPVRVPPNPAFAQPNPVSVDDAIARRAKDYGEQRIKPGAVQQPLRAGTKVGFMGRAAPIVAGGMEAMDVARVANNPGSTGLDVAEQTARATGRTAAATAGALGGAKIGAAIGAGGGPLAPATVPIGAGIGGIAGGIAGYYGADKLMTAGAGERAPADQLRTGAAGSPNSNVPVNMITGSSGRVPESALRAPSTFTTGDGRQGYLPPGISASRDANGNLVASGNAASIMAAGGGDPRALQTATMSAANSPLRPNLGEMGSNFAPVSSRASAINKQFDGLAQQIQRLHGNKAPGTLASKMLELEKARASALGQDQGALVDSQGNLVSDVGNRRSTESSLYGTDVGFEASKQRDSALRDSAAMRSQASLYKAQQEAIRANSSQVLEQITAEAKRLFEDPKDQQAYIDDRYLRTPGLASGVVNAAEAAIVSGQDRPYSTNKLRANQLGNAKAEDFVASGPATRLPFDNAMEMGIGRGLAAYMDSALSGILPGGDSGAYYIEPGDTREARVLPADGMTIDEERALLRRQDKKR